LDSSGGFGSRPDFCGPDLKKQLTINKTEFKDRLMGVFWVAVLQADRDYLQKISALTFHFFTAADFSMPSAMIAPALSKNKRREAKST
jgi:hypothetical protein